MKKFLVALLILCSCTACGSANGGQGATSTNTTNHAVTIELDIYSGQPNPGWALTLPEITELDKRLQSLSILPTPPAVENLGYRGFLIHRTDSTDQTRVYHGMILITRADHIDAYQDDHELEAWLKKQADTHGYGALLKAAEQ